MPRVVGLVGGLGVGATVHYYESLVRAIAARNMTPGIVISHADMKCVLGWVEAKAIEDLAEYLAKHIERLSRAGAALAAIPAVAPHICAAELKRKIGLPLIDLTECVANELAARGARTAAILGTRFVMQSDMYGRLSGIKIVHPDAASVEFVHTNYMQIASTGSANSADVEGIRRIAKRLASEEGVDVVILAGTELSLAFNEADCGFPALDCARVHIDAIAMAATK